MIERIRIDSLTPATPGRGQQGEPAQSRIGSPPASSLIVNRAGSPRRWHLGLLVRGSIPRIAATNTKLRIECDVFSEAGRNLRILSGFGFAEHT